jgi:osmotically-inducible protein OsmY
MDDGRFEQDHRRGGHVEAPWGHERGMPRGRAEVPEWDSGSGVTERWGVGNTFGGVRDSQPSFAGRGPKGYQRSDDRIREDLCERLTEDHAIDASEITVQVQNGQVTLSGTVGDRGQKRRAEDLAEQVGGVREVVNSLRLSRQAPGSTTASTGAVS